MIHENSTMPSKNAGSFVVIVTRLRDDLDGLPTNLLCVIFEKQGERSKIMSPRFTIYDKIRTSPLPLSHERERDD